MGLVAKRAQGRERIVRSNPAELARARAALQRLERLWIDRSGQLEALLAAAPASAKE